MDLRESFVAKHVREIVARNVVQYPFMEAFDNGAVVIADISGYSTLASFLQQRYGDSSGARIQALLNPHFSGMIDAVHRHSGSVVKFAGDSLVAVWTNSDGGAADPPPSTFLTPGKDEQVREFLPTVDPANEEEDEEEDSRDATTAPSQRPPQHPPQQQQRTGFGDIASAFLCCLELLLMVDVLGRDAEDATSPEQRILQGVTVHIGLGCGATNHTHVGTMGDGCEYFVTGQSARDASTMLDMARPNELAIAADCWTVIKHEFTTLCPLAATGALDELVKPSFDDRGCVIIRSEIFASNYARHSLTWLLSMFSGDVLLPPVSPSPSSSSSNLGFSRTTATTTSPATAMRYNEYISGTIVHHLDDALSARELGETTSELRKCAVVFVRLTGTLATLATSGLGLGLSILQYLMTTVLESLDMFDGCLRQFNVDDKGPTLLLVWGVERYSHEEGEAAFALHAALRIARKLEQTYGTGCFSLGVAQGVVFSGVIGSPYRCDHTILGVAVNEAARLMCHPLTDECMVLVTEEIYADCKDQFLFSSSSHSIPVKGTTQPRRVFVPIRPLRTSNNNRDEKARRKKKDSIVGRKREQEVIRNTVAQWSQGGAPTLVIMGKTGTGKSLLGELVAEEAEKVVPGTVVCVGRASETQRYVPFFALSDILTSLFLDLDIKALAQKAEELAREDRDNGGEKRHRTPRYTMPSEDHPPVFKQRRAGETGAPRPSSTQTIPRLALPTQPLSRAARHGKHRSMDALKALSVTAGQQTHADAVAAAAAVAADSARATTDHTLGAASAAAGVVAGDRYGQFGGEGWTLLTKQRAPSDFAVPAGQTQVKPGSEAAASVSTAAVAAVPGAPSQCPFRRRRTRSSPQRPRIPCTRASHDADALVRKAREHEEVDGEALSAKTILFPETSPVAESFPSALTLGNIPKCDNAQRQSLTLDIPAVALTAPPASSSPSSSPETATPPSSPPPPSVTSPLSLTPPTSFRRGSLLPSPDLLAHHTAIDYIAPPFATSANNTTPTATTTTTTTMTSVACHPLCPRRTKLQRDMGAHTLVDAFGSVHLPGCYGTKGKTRLVGMMSKLAERVQSIIHLLGVNHHLLPLLNDVIPTSYPSTPFITNLGSHDRKVHLTNFITNILDVLTVEFEVPVVLVLDNAQWCDSMGTQLFYDVSRRCTRILAVWLTRPKGEYNMESSSYKILERIIVGGVERVNPVPPGDDGAAAAGMKKKKHRGDRAAEPFVAQQRENQNQQRQQQQQHDQSSPTTPRDQEQHQQHQQPSSTKPPIVISETGHAAIPAALLDLSGLSLSETEEMLLTIMRKRYTTAEGVDGRLVAEIFRRTGGNPVMIAMLTSSILERLDGMVVDGVLRIASRAHTASQLDGVLPQDAATVVLAHLDRTEPAMRHVLLVASVAGQHFKLHTLAALLIRNPVKEFAEFGLETPQGRQRLLEYLMEHDRFQFLKFTFEKSPVNKNQQLHHETTTKTEQQQEAAEETPGESDSAWMSSSGYSSEASSIMSESEAETSSSASSIASLSLSTRSGGSGSSYTRRHRHHKKKKDRENDEQTDVTNDNDDATTSNSNSNRVPQTEEYCSEIYFHHYVVYRAIYSTIIPSRRATLHASYAAHYAQTLSQADISLRSGTRDFFVATINLHLDRCRPLVPASTLLRFALDAFNMYASRAIISEAIDAYTRLEHLMKTYPEQAADTMDILARLRVLRLMCDLWLGAIDYHKGWEYFTKAMSELGVIVPAVSSVPWWKTAMKHVARQFTYRRMKREDEKHAFSLKAMGKAFPQYANDRTYLTRLASECMLCLDSAMHLAVHKNSLPCYMLVLLINVNLAEVLRSTQPGRLRHAYIRLGIGLEALGHRRLAKWYLKQGAAITPTASEAEREADKVTVSMTLIAFGEGDWHRVERASNAVLHSLKTKGALGTRDVIDIWNVQLGMYWILGDLPRLHAVCADYYRVAVEIDFESPRTLRPAMCMAAVLWTRGNPVTETARWYHLARAQQCRLDKAAERGATTGFGVAIRAVNLCYFFRIFVGRLHLLAWNDARWERGGDLAQPAILHRNMTLAATELKQLLNTVSLGVAYMGPDLWLTTALMLDWACLIVQTLNRSGSSGASSGGMRHCNASTMLFCPLSASVASCSSAASVGTAAGAAAAASSASVGSWSRSSTGSPASSSATSLVSAITRATTRSSTPGTTTTTTTSTTTTLQHIKAQAQRETSLILQAVHERKLCLDITRALRDLVNRPARQAPLTKLTLHYVNCVLYLLGGGKVDKASGMLERHLKWTETRGNEFMCAVVARGLVRVGGLGEGRERRRNNRSEARWPSPPQSMPNVTPPLASPAESAAAAAAAAASTTERPSQDGEKPPPRQQQQALHACPILSQLAHQKQRKHQRKKELEIPASATPSPPSPPPPTCPSQIQWHALARTHDAAGLTQAVREVFVRTGHAWEVELLDMYSPIPNPGPEAE